jgi:hypothetical protein
MPVKVRCEPRGEQQSKMIVVILAASRYDFESKEKTRLTGCKLECFQLEDPVEEDDRRGHTPFVLEASYALYGKIGELPGVYEMTTATKIVNGRDGKKITSLRAVDAKFLAPLIAPGEGAKKAS